MSTCPLVCQGSVIVKQRVEGAIQRSIRVQTDQIVSRQPVHVGKITAHQDLPVLVDSGRVNPGIQKAISREAWRIKGGIDGSVAIESRDVVAIDTVDLRKDSADHDLSVPTPPPR